MSTKPEAKTLWIACKKCGFNEQTKVDVFQGQLVMSWRCPVCDELVAELPKTATDPRPGANP